jgi:hypothetical protein
MTALQVTLDKRLPPLGRPKHPGLAALIGILTGGIGLAIYFRSVRDLFPVEVAGGLIVVASLVAGKDPLLLASFVAPVVGGLYGFWRAQSSNRRLGASIVPDDLVASVG